MAGSAPHLRINDGSTRTKRDEQLGRANLLKGRSSAFRNPAAHEPYIPLALTEQDALDDFGAQSLMHCLENATIST